MKIPAALPPLIFFFCLFLQTLSAFADTWTDPDWDEMITKSDLIGQFEVLEGGTFKAKLKPIHLYKGELPFPDIWLMGFSNKYGPIDSLAPGERYMLFVIKTGEYKGRYGSMSFSAEAGIMQKSASAAEFVLTQPNGYTVWTPTSGEYLIEASKVYCRLLSPSHQGKDGFMSLAEFEEFLIHAIDSSFHKKYQRKLTKKLRKALESSRSEMATQYLMMMRMTGNTQYEEVFEFALLDSMPETRYALALQLGVIPVTDARDLLVRMLKDSNTYVQSEVVRQLAKKDPEFLGPKLLELLGYVDGTTIEPAHIMDPIQDRPLGGKMQMIRTLGEIQYKPAVEVLLPLLETDNKYLFTTVIAALKQMGSQAYVPYLNKHLKKGSRSLIYSICDLIVEEDLLACKPALMDFISSHDRSKGSAQDVAISVCCGLGHFKDQETIDFLLRDFEAFLGFVDTLDDNVVRNWIDAYIEVFTQLRCEEARPILYEIFYRWHGLNLDFAENPELFEVKRHLEDSLIQEISTVLEEFPVDEVQTLVFIQNIEDILEAKKAPEFRFITQINLTYDSLIINLSENEREEIKIFYALSDCRKHLGTSLSIPIEDIGAKCDKHSSFSYVSNPDSRFESPFRSPIEMFYAYAKELPSESDLLFFQELKKTGFAKTEFDLRQLTRTIKTIEEKLD